MIKIGRLSQNIFSLVTLKGVDYILNFIMLPFLLRTLGAEKFGAIVFMQSVVQYFIIIVDYGFNMTAPRDIARAEEEQQVSKIFSNVLSAKFLILIVLLFCSSIIILLIPSSIDFDLLLFIAVIPTVLGSAIFTTWFFQGIQQMKYITISSVTARTLILLLLIVLIKQPEDYILAAFLQSCMMIVSGILSVAIIFKNYHYVFVRPSLNGIISSLKNGWQIFLSTVAINIYTTTNVVILGLLTNSETVGFFGAANKLIESVKGLMGAITQAVYPHVSTKLKESTKSAIAFIQKFAKIYVGLFFILSAIMSSLATPIIGILFGDGYEDTVNILRLLAWLPFIISFSNVFGIHIMLNFGKQQVFSRILIAAAILDFLIVLPLINYLGSTGITLTMLFVEIFVTIVMAIYINLVMKIHFFDNK